MSSVINNSGGTVAPGNSVGTLSIEGNYSQTGTGKLAIEVASASSADKLQLTSGFPNGSATLGGVVEMTRLGGYVPPAGTRWTILTCRVRNGQFAGVTAANPVTGVSYRLLYNANNSVDVLVLGACGPADVGSQGGIAGPDNHLDNNDFVVFINSFFNQDPIADVGVQGGAAGSDGFFDNNDFVVYINSFFIVCS